MSMFCADCHEPITRPEGHCGTGYATFRATTTSPEFRVCYDCAATRERLNLRTEREAFAYLAEDCKHVTTWTGRALMRVTSVSAPKRVGFGRRIYVNAVDPLGRKWHGSGPAGTDLRAVRAG